MGTEVAGKGNEAVETVETVENEVEETVEEGSVAVEDEESSTAIEDKEDSTYAEAEISEEAAESSEDDSEDDEEEKEEEDDPERLSELEILPGKTAYINFYYTIDPEIEGMKDQKVDFSFAYTLEDEEGKQTKNTLRETFRYAVDTLNLMTVTAGGEKGYVETGKEDEMLLEFDLGLMREVLEEAIEEELEKTENGDASAAEAKRASASELLVGWEDENGERPLGKKDPAVIKNLKCEVETFGVKLDKFKAVPVKDDDNFGTSLKCSFYVSRKTLPGTYYGRVNASYKIKGKSFHTTQGFKVVVKQETGEMELVGKIGDSEIVMTGPVSSFPKADELSLKVSEITQEQQEKVDEALQKKAEEEGTEINQYKALDIKLIADGVETEPEGDVQVRFKNVNLEKVDEKKEAEQEKAEEQSMVKKAVRKVMSLFSARDEEEDVAAVAETGTEGEAETKDSNSVKSEGSEEGAEETGEATENSENIKVLHLDEDAVVANEMTSEVKNNGDVVMDTDHFSIYIVVDMEKKGGNITVTVEHYGTITTIAARANGDFKRVNDNPYGELVRNEKGELVVEPGDLIKDGDGNYLSVNEATDPYGDKTTTKGAPLWDDRGSKEVIVNGKKMVVPDSKSGSGASPNIFGYHPKDLIYDRHTQTINTIQLPGTQIYTPQTITLQNELAVEAEDISKIFFTKDENGKDVRKELSDMGYEIASITVINNASEDNKKTESNPINELTYTIFDEVTKDENGKSVTVKKLKYDVTDENGAIKTIKTDKIILTSDCTVRFNYIEKKARMVYHDVSFYDHNVSFYSYDDPYDSGQYGKNSDKKDTYVIGKDSGTNDSKGKGFVIPEDVSEPISRIEAGQHSSGNISDWNSSKSYVGNDSLGKSWTSLWNGKQLNSGNKKVDGKHPYGNYKDGNIEKPKNQSDNYSLALPIAGIVEDTLNADSTLRFNSEIAHPDFFSEIYNEEKKVYASKLINDYKLGFIKNGDTYTLSSVGTGEGGRNVLSGLENIHYSVRSWNGSGLLFSNEFWPLDEITKYKGMDPMGPNKSDDGKVHNWHFGMHYVFDFTVGDYLGPMNFYFRGDDDFWMYVDGKKVIDLGGIHSAVGKAVNMRTWFEENGYTKEEIKGTHTVHIYFMERGGTGSCCYIQYTLPNCVPVNIPESPTLDLTVKKEWSEEVDAISRPKGITVELLRKRVSATDNETALEQRDKDGNLIPLDEDGFAVIDEDGIESQKHLGGEVWECKWTMLPKYNPEEYMHNTETASRYYYKVREKDGKGYKPLSYEYKVNGSDENVIIETLKPEDITNIDCTITNTLDDAVNVEVEKIWNDGGNNETLRQEIVMQLQYKKYGDSDDEFLDFPGAKGILKLNGKKDAGESPNPNGETVEEFDSWKGRFTNLPYYIDKDIQVVVKNPDGTPVQVQNDKGEWVNKTETKTIRVPIVYRVREVKQETDGSNTVLKDNESILPDINGIDYVVTYEDTNEEEKYDDITSDSFNPEPPKPEDSTDSSNPEPPPVASTKVTNTARLDKTVVKRWENIPGTANPIAKIGLYKKITSTDGSTTWKIINHFAQKIDNSIIWAESGENNEEKQDFILELTYSGNPDSSSCIGKWENLPIYDDAGKIEYGIFELDDSEMPIIIPKEGEIIATIGSQKYKVTSITQDIEISGTETMDDEDNISETNEESTSSSEKQDVVVITNQYKVEVVLPDTGGPGLLMMSRLGWMLLLLALLMAGMEIQFYGERRSRKAATVQREDTRGFDPDDY